MSRRHTKRKRIVRNLGAVWTEISVNGSRLKKCLESILGSAVTGWNRDLLMAWTRLKTIQQKWPNQTIWECQCCEDPPWRDDRRGASRKSQSQYCVLTVFSETCLQQNKDCKLLLSKFWAFTPIWLHFQGLNLLGQGHQLCSWERIPFLKMLEREICFWDREPSHTRGT